MRTAVFTTTWNEAMRLPRWISHYGMAVGSENLWVIDDGSDDGSTERLGAVNVVRRLRERYDERARTALVNNFATDLLSRYDTVVYADVDELLVPVDGSAFGDWLERPHPAVVTAIGMDVMEVPGIDEPLDPMLPLLAQRRHARLNPTYCKPLVARVPILWRPGMHFSDAETAFDGLLLLHTRYAHRAAGLARLVQLRTVEIADSEVFATHWRVQDEAFTDVLDSAALADWRPLNADYLAFWERLLCERLASHPPNAVERIRDLWNNHPSWFTLPDGLRCG